MKKEIAMKWVGALRSGRYTQAQSCLFRLNVNGEKQHCCLGVLQDLLAPKSWLKNTRSIVDEKVEWVGIYAGRGRTPNFLCLSERVKKAAGMYSTNGYFRTIDREKIGAGEQVGLAAANDNGVSFEDIANFIEQNWEKL